MATQYSPLGHTVCQKQACAVFFTLFAVAAIVSLFTVMVVNSGDPEPLPNSLFLNKTISSSSSSSSSSSAASSSGSSTGSPSSGSGTSTSRNSSTGPSVGLSSSSIISSSSISSSSGASIITNNITQFIMGANVLTSTVEFYGDSITAGTGLTSNNQRYSNLLATQYGFTMVNTAVGGDTVQDMLSKIYNTHVSGNLASVMIGYNDVAVSFNTDATYYQFKESLMGQLLYLTLNSTQLLSNRGASTTRVGTWSSSSFTNGGSFTTTSGDSVNATVPRGRYIGFFLTIGTSVPGNFTVSVDGGAAVSATVPICFTTLNGAVNNMIPWVYDTGIIGAAHFITVTNQATSTLSIEFFFGFDNLASNGSSAVILIGNYADNFQQGSAATFIREKLITETQQKIATFLRQTYAAKITFVNELPYWSWGNKVSDMIHPDARGQIRILNRINTVLANGELVSYT